MQLRHYIGPNLLFLQIKTEISDVRLPNTSPNSPESMSEKRLFLLDAYALIFRAYYALIKMPRITSEGFNTSAIFGFVNTLEDVLRKEQPSHIAVCFDPPGPTFRSGMLESYKGERAETPAADGKGRK